VGSIGAAREVGIGSDLVIKFHTQFYKFVEVLRFISLVDKAGLEFFGESSLEGGLLCLRVIIQNCYQTLKFSIINAKFMFSLYEAVQFPRGYSNFIRIAKGGFQDFD
jgi:hypothetical protein